MQPSDYSMQGAIDLGARKAAMEREAKREAEQASGTANPYAIDVDESNFQQVVLEGSTRAPVVLAVLQARSEQSAQVESALDRLAVGAGGQWALAKVDVQANPQIAQAMRVQAVPTVALVIGGQVVPGPAGPADEAQLRQWLTEIFEELRRQQVLPAEYAGLGPEDAADEAEAEPAEDPVEDEARQALERGDFAAAEAVYAAEAERDPRNEEAKLRLAWVRVARRTEGIDAQAALDAAAQAPDDVDAQLAAADVEVATERYEAAFDRLVDLVRRTRDDDRDRARTRLLSLFEVLPPGDPAVAAARRALTSALF
ncbi:tetratricopeptide repeat protein [Nocardiopsis coralliicola]